MTDEHDAWRAMPPEGYTEAEWTAYCREVNEEVRRSCMAVLVGLACLAILIGFGLAIGVLG